MFTWLPTQKKFIWFVIEYCVCVVVLCLVIFRIILSHNTMESQSEKGLWSFSSSGIHFWFSIIRCYYRISMICMMRKSAKDMPISMLFWKWYGTTFEIKQTSLVVVSYLFTKYEPFVRKIQMMGPIQNLGSLVPP